MRLSISHTTTYRYDNPVRHGLQELRLWPRFDPVQSVNEWHTELDGASHELFFDDEYGNRVQLVTIEPDTTETVVRAHGEVETSDSAGVVARHLGHTPLWFYDRPTDRTIATAPIRKLAEAVAQIESDVERLHALSAEIRTRVDYRTGRSDVETTADEALAAGVGVCQDHAHIYLAAARGLGYPSRYVSGYLHMADEEQEASHAWTESWISGLGWVGFDVANGISPDERYVRLAVGLDYRAAAPISGIRYGEGEESLSVSLEVRVGGGQQ
ncbi:MAG: transglutaminase family protein [Actinomycetota bacterium]